MSDDEEQYNPKAHKKLLKAVSNLGNVQHITKSTRDEHQPKQDEFQLVKRDTNAENVSKPVGVNDLVQILRTSKHIETGKKLKNVHNTKKVLDKPLEKPAADRIKRTIGYEGAKKTLGRWDAVVAKQRSAETQIFPIPSETIYVNTAAHVKHFGPKLKSNLARELQANTKKLKELRKAKIGDTTDTNALAEKERQLLEKKMAQEDIQARRRELVYLKMRESQKSAKARMQNKIKSKKYHKLEKRQKLMQQIKEFEQLQKTNPEAALEKLNALEKSRVMERASLRHKNTGTWAKNLQVRAKYDKDVRKDLAEQLAVSRQLTEKKMESESENDSEYDDDNEDDKEREVDPFNPWLKGKNTKGDGQIEDTEDANWRKYWIERNANEKLLQEHREQIEVAEKESIQKTEEIVGTKKKSKKKNVVKSVVDDAKLKKIKTPATTKSLDEIFEQHEDVLRAKLNKKLKKLKKEVGKLQEPTKKTKKATKKKVDELKNLSDLTFKKTKQRVEIDEPLNQEEETPKPASDVNELSTLEDNQTSSETPVNTIDPNKVTLITPVTWKQKKLSADVMTDALVEDDEADYDETSAAAERQMTIAEAFQDDDIIADFNKDKADDSEIKNAELQLGMPGWGSWAGAGISQEVTRRRNKRLLLKLAAPEKRRDDNKSNLYINETSNKQARAHMVSSIPFPFKSLADYEASIRAPIGRSFVPETAFRMMVRPSVITRKGQVIEPMDDSELVKPERQLRHVVDRRISRLQNKQKAKIA